MFTSSSLSNLTHHPAHHSCDNNNGTSNSNTGNNAGNEGSSLSHNHQDQATVVNQALAHQQQASLNQSAHLNGGQFVAGQSIFSIGVQHGQQTNVHNNQHNISTTPQQQHSQHHPLTQQAQHSSSTIPHILDTTTQHLVPLFSQNSAVLQGGNLTDSLGLVDANQFMLMQQQQQQQQQQQHHHQQQTTHTSQDISAFNTAAFLHHSTALAHHHPSQASISTTTNSNQHQPTSNQQQQHHQAAIQSQQIQPHQLNCVNVIAANSLSASANTLDNMGLNNAGHVIIDQTCNGLIKLHNGSGAVHPAAIVVSNFNDLCHNRNINTIAINSSNNCIDGDSNNNNHNDSLRVSTKKRDIIRGNGLDTLNSSATKIGPISYKNNNNNNITINNMNDINVNNLLNNVANQTTTTISSSNSTIGSTASTLINNININCSNGKNSNSRSKNNTNRTGNGNSRKDKQASQKTSAVSPRRTFACPTCAKGFTEKFNMKRHMQIHSQTRPKYVCSECSKSFAWKDNFIRHKKASHPR